jgi:hypothetical protein
MNEGYIKLHRKLINSRVFQNEGLLKVWVWCLLKANHKATWVSIKTGKHTIEVWVEAGEFIFGRESAAKELRMPPSTVWKRIVKLKNLGNCEIKSDSQYSIVSIVNWDIYQSLENQKEQAESRETGCLPQHSKNEEKKSGFFKKGQKRDSDKIYNSNDKSKTYGTNENQKEQPGNSQGTAREQPGNTNKNDKNNNKTPSCSSGDERPPEINPFDEFWKHYPRKVGKGAALTAWKKVEAPKSTLLKIITALTWQNKSDQWTRDNGRYIPYPATYLNQRRWEDEPPEGSRESTINHITCPHCSQYMATFEIKNGKCPVCGKEISL